MKGSLVLLTVVLLAPLATADVQVARCPQGPDLFVASLDSASLVTWQGEESPGAVEAMVIGEGGASAPFVLVPGRLLGVHSVGDVVHVVAFDAATSSVDVVTIPKLWEPGPVPNGAGASVPDPILVPIASMCRELSHDFPSPIRVPLPEHHFPNPIPVPLTRHHFPNHLPIPAAEWYSGHIPFPIPIPIERVPLLRTFGAAPLESSPPPEFLTSPDTWQPCVAEEDGEVLIAWQAGRSVLGRIVLDRRGVEGAGEFFRGPNGGCPALLGAARRH